MINLKSTETIENTPVKPPVGEVKNPFQNGVYSSINTNETIYRESPIRPNTDRDLTSSQTQFGRSEYKYVTKTDKRVVYHWWLFYCIYLANKINLYFIIKLSMVKFNNWTFINIKEVGKSKICPAININDQARFYEMLL